VRAIDIGRRMLTAQVSAAVPQQALDWQGLAGKGLTNAATRADLNFMMLLRHISQVKVVAHILPSWACYTTPLSPHLSPLRTLIVPSHIVMQATDHLLCQFRSCQVLQPRNQILRGVDRWFP
jgi:hypothetical protein